MPKVSWPHELLTYMLCTRYASVMNEYPPEWHHCSVVPHPQVCMEKQWGMHDLKLVVLIAYLSKEQNPCHDFHAYASPSLFAWPPC